MGRKYFVVVYANMGCIDVKWAT